jgi:transposase-like protein
MSFTLTTVCPRCGAESMAFAEHGSAGALYRCHDCGHAAVIRRQSEREEDDPPTDFHSLFRSRSERSS